MKGVLKKLIFSVLSVVPRNSAKASVLMYHSVGENTAEFTVSPSMFERQLRYLQTHGYDLLPVSVLVERIRAGKPLSSLVSLTFDDGYEDMYTVVFPIIKKLRVPISIFLATGRVGDTFTTSRGDILPMLTWEQILEMQVSGLVEFLPHGRMHHALPMLSADEMHEEIMGAVSDLEEKLGTVRRIYAYAKGKYTNETLQILTQEGFEAAMTVRPGYITARSSLLELPRHHMDAHTSFAEFKSRVRGSAEWYERLKLLK